MDIEKEFADRFNKYREEQGVISAKARARKELIADLLDRAELYADCTTTERDVMELEPSDKCIIAVLRLITEDR